MITVKKKTFFSLKDIWKILYSDNAVATPFASYEYARILNRAYAFDLYYGGVPCFFVFYKNGIPIMIAPLVRHLTRGGFKYIGFGSRFGVVSEDFIYGDSLPEDDMEACLRLLLSKVEHICFRYLSDSSLLYRVLREKFSSSESGNQINVMLKLPATYEEYIASLSKKMHKNIRMIYNRMKTDNCDFRFEVFRGVEMPESVYKQFLRLYSKSYNLKNSSRNWWRKKSYPIRVKYLHPHAMAINRIDSSMCGVLFINGEVAAAMGGYLQKNNEYYLIPRITYDKKYSRYSPGVILLLETIKYLISNKIPIFDWSRGDEEYKLWLGGQVYYQYAFDATK